MKFTIEESTVKYEIGQCFLDFDNEVFMIIGDSQAVALLRLQDGVVMSEFYRNISTLRGYTNLDEMVPLEQIDSFKFRKIGAEV